MPRTQTKSPELRAPARIGYSGPLGIKTKSITPPCSKDGVVEDCETPIRALRRDRYALGRVARAIYAKQGERERLPYVLNYHRTAKCGYLTIADEIGINKSTQHNKAFFTGINTCGSVWTCPSCGAKIQERRRAEITQGLEFMYNAGKKAVMVTITFPHGMGDDLAELLAKQAKALQKLRAGSPWSRLKARTGFEGLIRSLEITYGQNGYHPHTHELWFVDPQVNTTWLHSEVLKRWESACIKAGLLDGSDDNQVKHFRQHSIDIKDKVSSSDYLAKQDSSRNWGADRELAKSSSKGSKAGVHPFQFLANFQETGDGIWAARWLDYSQAMQGKRQIFWSHGLKKRVGIGELTDEELAVIDQDEAKTIMDITPDQWHKIRRCNGQARVLDVAEDTSNPMVIGAVIEHLREPDTLEPEYRFHRDRVTPPAPLAPDKLDQCVRQVISVLPTWNEAQATDSAPVRVPPPLAQKPRSCQNLARAAALEWRTGRLTEPG